MKTMFVVSSNDVQKAVRASYELRVDSCSVEAGEAYFAGFLAGCAAVGVCESFDAPDDVVVRQSESEIGEIGNWLNSLLDGYIEGVWE